jgi:murein DD-endopeptidase MepM/ murein hydrolase activator NlpD
MPFFNINDSTLNIIISEKGFAWPVPNNTIISSYFGVRKSPTSFASTYHAGIDIPALEGSIIVSTLAGKVTYTGFNGSGGYTIIIDSGEYTSSYSHVSPYFLVIVGEVVSLGSIIGYVGPKYISNIPNNPYKDETGKATNGATTGSHLHFGLKKEGVFVNPLDYISSSSSSSPYMSSSSFSNSS